MSDNPESPTPETKPLLADAIDQAVAATPPAPVESEVQAPTEEAAAEPVPLPTPTTGEHEPIVAEPVVEPTADEQSATVAPEVEPAAEEATIPPVVSEPIAESQPAAADLGQTVPIVSNGATQANESVVEPIAQVAPESPPAEEQVSVAIEPSDATAAASVAQDGQTAATPVTSPQSAEPDPVSELTASLAAQEEKSELLAQANEVLRGQLGLAMESLDQSRAEFDQAKAGMRAEIIAMVDKLHDEICQFQQRAQAVEAVPAGDRVRVFLRQPAIVAGEAQELGTTLGFVILSPGVSLNFLVDAVRNGIAKGR